MKLRLAGLVLLILIPAGTFASEVCARFMEADSAFRLEFDSIMSPSTGMSNEQKRNYYEEVFLPALKKYADTYMDTYPGGRKSKDDMINLELASAWRNEACPGVSYWTYPTVAQLWIEDIYSREKRRESSDTRLPTPTTCMALAERITKVAKGGAYGIQSIRELVKLETWNWDSLESEYSVKIPKPHPGTTRVLDCFGIADIEDRPWSLHFFLYRDTDGSENVILRRLGIVR